jgi:glycosyltransferase involved in cell wall biosynthesis
MRQPFETPEAGMRIGILAPPWVTVPPTAYGGTEAVVDQLARGLERAGHEVMLWTTGDSACPVARGHIFASAQGERIGSAVVELNHVIAGYEALADWGADIVHDHTLTGPLCADQFHLPVVTTNHGPFEGDLAALYRRIAPRMPVIAISQDQARRARGIPIAAMIHHGLDPDAYPMGAGDGDDDGLYFLFLGRIIPEKGVDHAARAVRRAGGRLLIAAKMREDHEHRFFAEHLEPLLGDNIVYLGEVPHEEKLRLLAGATALVNPLRWPEPFGMVMIEALACGTPVVGYRFATVPEIVDHGVTGYLCDGMENLAAKLTETRRLDRAACRAAVAQRFTTQRMVAEHLALFESVMDGRRVSSNGLHPQPTSGDGEVTTRETLATVDLTGGAA